jgi:hypothetical protein
MSNVTISVPDQILELAGRSRRKVGIRTWTRDELHER